MQVIDQPAGLGLIAITNDRKSGEGIRSITLADVHHPVIAGCRKKMKIWYENGPAIRPGRGVETLALYDDGSAAVVCATFGKGSVVIFSPHPEGSVKSKEDAQELGTLEMLRNAIRFASGPR